MEQFKAVLAAIGKAVDLTVRITDLVVELHKLLSDPDSNSKTAYFVGRVGLEERGGDRAAGPYEGEPLYCGCGCMG